VKYFPDTNIFMYAAGREHSLKAPCVAVLRRVAREELEVLTNEVAMRPKKQRPLHMRP
jgi:predicted nucleic acid-binding protein